MTDHAAMGSRAICAKMQIARTVRVFAVMDMPVMLKACTSCHVEKPATTDFWHKLKRGKFGLNSVCTECRTAREAKRRTAPEYAEYYRAWKAANPDKVQANAARYAASGRKAEADRKYREANADDLRAKKLAYREANREAHRKRRAAYRERNLEMARRRGREWNRANPAKVLANVRVYQSTKARRTPPWLTTQDRQEMARLYQLARDLTASTGVRHEVDHVVPLRGRTACGLHVPWNLRVVPAVINRRKGNRLE